MKIVWAPNPMRTVVELDEADKRLLVEKLKVEYLQGRIDAAYFDLDPEMRAWRAERGLGETTLEAAVESARRSLDVEYTTGDEPRNGKTLDQYNEERLGYYVQALLEPHMGDCTCIPCSCTKCHAESFLKIDTIAGLGKHEASKILWAFRVEGQEEEVSILDAVKRLAEYEPAYTPSPTWPEKEWRKHVPRWIEEGHRAHAWLVKYLEEHFAITVR